MATQDVPGANPVNGDELHAGCWAEHDDGSLIFVQGAEGGRVIFSVFDVSKDPATEYRDAMPVAGFESDFTGNGWTWHDKTPFPWERVMRDFPAGPRHASADDLLNAAERVAERRKLRQRIADIPDDVRALTKTAQDMVGRLQDAINRLGR